MFDYRKLVSVVGGNAISAAKLNYSRCYRMVEPLVPNQEAFRKFLMEDGRMRPTIYMIAVGAIGVERRDRRSRRAYHRHGHPGQRSRDRDVFRSCF